MLVHRTSVSEVCARVLVCDRHAATWNTAFTHSSFDGVDNYKMLEQCGDATIHHFIKNHILDRLPHFHRNPSKYVGVVENINQRCVSRSGLSVLARDLGFMPFISYDNTETAVADSGGYAKPLSQMLEDTFESFIGALEKIVNDHVGNGGAGYAICSEFLHNLFTTHPKFADLEDRVRHLDVYPAKTIILEFAKDQQLRNKVCVEFARTRKRATGGGGGVIDGLVGGGGDQQQQQQQKGHGGAINARAPGERCEDDRAPGTTRSSAASTTTPAAVPTAAGAAPNTASGPGGVYVSECTIHVLSDFGAPIRRTFFGEDRCKKPAEEIAAARALRYLVARGTLDGTKYLINYADPAASL